MAKEEILDIINHSVVIDDIGFLQFLYPNFIILNKPVLFSEKPIIFVGETKYINQIKSLGVDYIVVSATGEIDLTDKLTLLKVVFHKYNRPVPKYLLEFYNDLDDYTFRELVEEYWLTGKWRLKEFDNTGAFLEFLYSFKTDTYQISKSYLELLHKTGAEYLEMSLLTFLNRVVNPGSRLSKWYLKTINDFKLSKYQLIEPALYKYMQSPIYNSELRIFNLIMDLNRKH